LANYCRAGIKSLRGTPSLFNFALAVGKDVRKSSRKICQYREERSEVPSLKNNEFGLYSMKKGGSVEKVL
jgi:hypothetical protein